MITSLSSMSSTSDQTPNPIQEMKHSLSFFESIRIPRKRSSESCIYPQFKKKLCQSPPNWPSPALVLDSLNRTEELGEDIAAADPIFKSSALKQAAVLTLNNAESESGKSFGYSRCSTSWNTQSTLPDEAQNFDSRNLDFQNTMEPVVVMHVDDEDNGTKARVIDGFLADELVEKSFSEAEFLRKVMEQELGNDTGFDHKLLVIAVHAVLLDSGFVSFDPIADAVINGFRFPHVWPSGAFTISLCYTLPEIVNGVQGKQTQSVLVKFQSVGKFLNVYGSVGGSGESGNTRTHSVRMVQLNEDQLLPYLNVWANCGENDNLIGKYAGIMGKSPEKVVLKFWRTIKDSIALPLLIDICENAGLPLPPCFMRLPSHLKFKILELLSSDEIAQAACVCWELRDLAYSEYLWCDD